MSLTTVFPSPPQTPAACTCQLHTSNSPFFDCLPRRTLLCILRKLAAFSMYLKTQNVAGHGSDPIVHRANVLFRSLTAGLVGIFNYPYWDIATDGFYTVLPAAFRMLQLVESTARLLGCLDIAETCQIALSWRPDQASMNDLKVAEWESGADRVKGLEMWKRMGWWEKRRMRKALKEADNSFVQLDAQMDNFRHLLGECNGAGGGWCEDCRGLVLGLVTELEQTDSEEESIAESVEVED